MIILMTFRGFQWNFSMESGKYKNKDYTFVSLHQHLPGPSEEVWTLGLVAPYLNNFLGTR